MNGKPILFLAREASHLRPALEDTDGVAGLGEFSHLDYPDGEQGVRVMTNVAGKDVLYVLPITPTTNWVTDVAGPIKTFNRLGAVGLRVAVPWMAYSTQERAVQQGEVVAAEAVASMLSAVVGDSSQRRIYLHGLHTPTLEYYFSGRTCHYAPDAIIDAEIMKMVTEPENTVICSTDAGGSKTVARIAERLGFEPGFIYKKRVSGDTTEVIAASCDVQGKHVIFFDDMLRTGSSLRGAGKSVTEHGAKSVKALIPHGVLPGDAAKKMFTCGLFKQIVVSDSHPNVPQLNGQYGDFYRVFPIVRPMVEFILANP